MTMWPEVARGFFVEVTTKRDETLFIPTDIIDVDKSVTEIEPLDCFPALGEMPKEVYAVDGWGYRLTMPGHMDRTDWCVYDTESDLLVALEEERFFLDGDEVVRIKRDVGEFVDWMTRMRAMTILLNGLEEVEHTLTQGVKSVVRMPLADQWDSLSESDRERAYEKNFVESQHLNYRDI